MIVPMEKMGFPPIDGKKGDIYGESQDLRQLGSKIPMPLPAQATAACFSEPGERTLDTQHDTPTKMQKNTGFVAQN